MEGNALFMLGMVAGVLTAFSLVPQLIKMLKEKKFDTVSPVMLIVLLVGQSLWIAYGVFRDDWPIIGTNAFSCAVNITILTLRLIHGKGKETAHS
ncbi:MAG TPA: SemiSWEET transporter [Chitinophagales bacterium]|nr:SemiSWEET transporter [Chitinophagales bacterium]